MKPKDILKENSEGLCHGCFVEVPLVYAKGGGWKVCFLEDPRGKRRLAVSGIWT